jgi:hypothetical protein
MCTNSGLTTRTLLRRHVICPPIAHACVSLSVYKGNPYGGSVDWRAGEQAMMPAKRLVWHFVRSSVATCDAALNSLRAAHR